MFKIMFGLPTPRLSLAYTEIPESSSKTSKDGTIPNNFYNIYSLGTKLRFIKSLNESCIRRTFDGTFKERREKTART